jgi:hypothetical protein
LDQPHPHIHAHEKRENTTFLTGGMGAKKGKYNLLEMVPVQQQGAD